MYCLECGSSVISREHYCAECGTKYGKTRRTKASDNYVLIFKAFNLLMAVIFASRLFMLSVASNFFSPVEMSQLLLSTPTHTAYILISWVFAGYVLFLPLQVTQKEDNFIDEKKRQIESKKQTDDYRKMAQSIGSRNTHF